jgi:putative transposase
MAPADVYEGYVEVITERRAEVLKGAYEQDRLRPLRLHAEAWINRGDNERQLLDDRESRYWVSNP